MKNKIILYMKVCVCVCGRKRDQAFVFVNGANLHLKQPSVLLPVFVFLTLSNLSKPSPLQRLTSATYLSILVGVQPVVSIPPHTPTNPLS